jgi:formiminoglutamase
VDYIKTDQFSMHRLEQVKREIKLFTDKVDFIYLTIDLDGFSSAYAPGVSAASPMGFSPDIVLEALKVILDTKKMISMDIAELNPALDRDNQTAKLAASLVHFIIHKVSLL